MMSEMARFPPINPNNFKMNNLFKFGDDLLRREITLKVICEKSNFQTVILDKYINYLQTYLMMFKPRAKGRKFRLNVTTLKIVF